MKTTEWFPGDVHPVREGVYQLHNTSTGIVFHANWHKGAWALGYMKAWNAAQFKMPCVVQDRWPWRGLTERAA